MQPDYVANAIHIAVDGSRVGYVLGTSTKVWALLDRWLPEFARRKMIGYLAG